MYFNLSVGFMVGLISKYATVLFVTVGLFLDSGKCWKLFRLCLNNTFSWRLFIEHLYIIDQVLASSAGGPRNGSSGDRQASRFTILLPLSFRKAFFLILLQLYDWMFPDYTCYSRTVTPYFPWSLIDILALTTSLSCVYTNQLDPDNWYLLM